MSVPPRRVVLTPHRRRQMAAMLLRGKLERYDTLPTFTQVMDRLIDDLVISAVAESIPGWDSIADRLVRQFAYRAISDRQSPASDTTEPVQARAA